MSDTNQHRDAGLSRSTCSKKGQATPEARERSDTESSAVAVTNKEYSTHMIAIVIWRGLLLLQFIMVLIPLITYDSTTFIITTITIWLLLFIIHIIIAIFCSYEKMESEFVLHQKKGDFTIDVNKEALFCDYCLCFVVEGTKHCRRCDICVEKFDHHCKWINNCVGGKNYRKFVFMIVLALGFILWEFGLNLYYFVKILQNLDDDWQRYDIYGIKDVDKKFFLVWCSAFALGSLVETC